MYQCIHIVTFSPTCIPYMNLGVYILWLFVRQGKKYRLWLFVLWLSVRLPKEKTHQRYNRWLWMAMHLWSMSKKTYYQNNQSRLILWKITTSTRQIGLPDALVERRNYRQECSRYYWCLTKEHSTTLPVHARCLQHQATEHPTRLRRTRSRADRRKSI